MVAKKSAVKKSAVKKVSAKKTPAKKNTVTKKPASKNKVVEAVKHTIELILVRPRRDEKTKIDFYVHVKGEFKTKGYVKLGPYSEDSRADEWCHSDDAEYYRDIRKNEMD